MYHTTSSESQGSRSPDFSPKSWRVFKRPMARASIVGLTLALAAVGCCFLGGVPTQPPRAPPVPSHVETLGAAPTQSQSEGGCLMQQKDGWNRGTISTSPG